MITFSGVTKQYTDDAIAVDSLHLQIESGEFFVLIGPSGCGKTTTLKMINRLIDATSGTILIDGKEISAYDIHELRWNIGYVLQQIALFPHMTIEENIATVPELKKWKREQIKHRVDELLEKVGLDPAVYRNRKPSELSGGQQQRVGVARALAADPRIILMDEPFSALDPISREKLQDDVVELQQRIKKTIVFVTHDMQEALKLGDRICIMKEGKVVQVGTPDEIVHSPANDFVKEFIGTESSPSTDIDLESLLDPIKDQKKSLPAIPVQSSLKETLEALTLSDELVIEKDGKTIGILNRQKIVQYMASRMQERGKSDE
ncbi:ABC transporter ATP-binding protein [Bacillus sp. FJAT-50079]|uniref:ABC transporter ATP-binding protein n=1 Tax=Bacillus sp. FJAT-50079 TaxID=2833577 RepID=UPI001BC9DA85|nr:ABC transporter ATP-binding protein [Bacillus sp. FJAT-50079]MBS4210097.1 ABC transporter ATP-binding protein [Bacillus sp. FJAT-50079]